MRRKQRESLGSIGFLNLAFAFAKAMMVVMLVCFALISKKNNEYDGPKPKAEIQIEITWAHDSKHDIDMWVLPPNLETVSYYHPLAMNSLIGLERDDRGENNHIVVDGKEINNSLRSEIVTVRGVVPGKFSVSAFLYAYNPTTPLSTKLDVGTALPTPVPFEIRIFKINPTTKLMYFEKKTFTRYGQEVFCITFDVDNRGEIVNLRTSPMISVINGKYPPGAFIRADGGNQ